MPRYDEKKPDRLKPAAARKPTFRSCHLETAVSEAVVPGAAVQKSLFRSGLSEAAVSEWPFRSCLLEIVPVV